MPFSPEGILLILVIICLYVICPHTEALVQSKGALAVVTSTEGNRRSSPSPIFVSTDNQITVAPSHMALLPCSVKNLGERQIVWRRLKDDEFLTIGQMVFSKDPRILVEHKVKENGITSWDLIVRNVQHDDAGIYECQVTTTEKIVWNVDLQVVEPVTSKAKTRINKQAKQSLHTSSERPTNGIINAGNIEEEKEDDNLPDDQVSENHLSHDQLSDDELSSLKTEYITAGLPIRLMCNISVLNGSNTVSSVKWYKDGKSVEESRHILLTRYLFEADMMSVTELIISQAHITDSGVYHCRTDNDNSYVIKIFVLPNTKISSVNNRDDHHPHKATDSIQTENGVAYFSLSLLIFVCLGCHCLYLFIRTLLIILIGQP